MSWYKDQWNEAHYSAYEEAREAGASEHQAQAAGEAAAQQLTERLLDEADMLRKRRREEGA